MAALPFTNFRYNSAADRLTVQLGPVLVPPVNPLVSRYFGTTAEAERKAMREMGYYKDSQKEAIINSARGDNVRYAAYLQAKEQNLNAIRAEVGAHYAEMLVGYRRFGYPEETAKAEALAFSKEIYKLLMKLFESIYPPDGAKIKKQF